MPNEPDRPLQMHRCVLHDLPLRCSECVHQKLQDKRANGDEGYL